MSNDDDNAPPPALGCARVLSYAVIDEKVTFTGRTLLFVDGEELGPVPRLAICEERKAGEILLFHCDGEWAVLGCSAHSSVDDAKVRAERNYTGLSGRWIDAHVSADAAEAYLDEVLSRCSFCGRRSDKVEEMIADETEKANICDCCIEEFHKNLCELRKSRQ